MNRSARSDTLLQKHAQKPNFDVKSDPEAVLVSERAGLVKKMTQVVQAGLKEGELRDRLVKLTHNIKKNEDMIKGFQVLSVWCGRDLVLCCAACKGVSYAWWSGRV